MTKEIEIIKNLRISGLKPSDIEGVGKRVLNKLSEAESLLIESGIASGLPYFLAESDESVRELSRLVGISHPALLRVFKHYGIPHRTQSEASAIALKKTQENPEAQKKSRAGRSKRMKELWQDPAFREKNRKAINAAVSTPESHLRRSVASKQSWQNPERRKKISNIARVNALKQWQNPSTREKMLEAQKERWANTEPIEKKPKKRKTTSGHTREETARILSDRMRKLWQDPVYREKQVKSQKQKWEVPQFRDKQTCRLSEHLRQLRQDPVIQAKKNAGMKRYWQDPEHRRQQSERSKKMMTDPENRTNWEKAMIELRASPEFRTKQLEGIRKVLDDPEFQARRIQGVKKKWSDPEFRSKKVAEARLVITKLNQDTDQLDKAAKGIRKLRSDPESSKLFVLPTIQGFRKDIGYYALSAWEANFARVIKFTGRQFYPKESFSLSVSEPYTKLFHFDTTQYTVDYVVEDPRGNLIVYDLIAHPIEDPVGLAKADMFKHQYPDIPLHIISERLYRRIRKKYERIINNSDDFCGWETSKDNLYNNPAKYT